MIVRTAASCPSRHSDTVVPLRPVDGCPRPLSRVKDYITIGTPAAEQDTVAQPRPTIADIQSEVCAHYKLPASDMTGPRRSKAVAHPRQVAMFLSCQLTRRTLPEIGQRFGGRDHTTVIHARTVVPLRMAEHDELKEAVAIIRAAALRRAAERDAAMRGFHLGAEVGVD